MELAELTENPASTAEGVKNVTFPSPFDPVPDPEDDGLDVLAFADFMAATRAPGRQNPIPRRLRQWTEVSRCSSR